MRILILGMDGYLGWPLTVYLARQGHNITGIDLLSRRAYVLELNSHSILPIHSYEQRQEILNKQTGAGVEGHIGNILDETYMRSLLENFQPDVIVHLAEQPSAAYSMFSWEYCKRTMYCNVMGTLHLLWLIRECCPNTHLIKLGTMGEYGTPNSRIPEGHFPEGSFWLEAQPIDNRDREFQGSLSGLPFPKRAGSFYHLSKVHDSNNIEFACRTWGLTCTDIMQGVVYGTTIEGGLEPPLNTRFDVDQCFGTVINRFCAQAVAGLHLSIYGVGKQRRGFLPLRDSIQCINLILQNPPQSSEYQIINQFANVYSIQELAERVTVIGSNLGLVITPSTVPNPRVENEHHAYNPDHSKLPELGYTPQGNLDTELELILHSLLPHKERILQISEAIQPTCQWRPNL